MISIIEWLFPEPEVYKPDFIDEIRGDNRKKYEILVKKFEGVDSFVYIGTRMHISKIGDGSSFFGILPIVFAKYVDKNGVIREIKLSYHEAINQVTHEETK